MRISDWSSDVCSSDLPAQPEPATVRQHVRRRADLRADRADDAQLVAGPRQYLPDGHDAVHLGLRLDRVPHPDHHVAGLHLHDADDRLPQHGGREPLAAPPLSFLPSNSQTIQPEYTMENAVLIAEVLKFTVIEIGRAHV